MIAGLREFKADQSRNTLFGIPMGSSKNNNNSEILVFLMLEKDEKQNTPQPEKKSIIEKYAYDDLAIP